MCGILNSVWDNVRFYRNGVYMAAIIQIDFIQAPEPTIIQLAFDPADDRAYVKYGGKYKLIPAWLACEWDTGIDSVIDTWQGGILKRYPSADTQGFVDGTAIPDVETEALNRIHRLAR